MALLWQVTGMTSPEKREKLQRTLETLGNALEVEIDGEELSYDESAMETQADSKRCSCHDDSTVSCSISSPRISVCR